jgi:NAD(P)-dependent dehydrogenase (short-subunit alcohol dehydrogenase family)
MTLKQYDELQRVAQYGAFITLREGARHMVARIQQAARSEPKASAGHQKSDRGGSLIATGSLTNFTATPGIGHYGAAKSAVAALIRNFALELGPHGIRANAVAPGPSLTEGAIEYIKEGAPQGIDIERQWAEAAGRVPMRRWADADEIARAVVFLASDLSAYVSGAQVVVDGGYLLG